MLIKMGTRGPEFFRIFHPAIIFFLFFKVAKPKQFPENGKWVCKTNFELIFCKNAKNNIPKVPTKFRGIA